MFDQLGIYFKGLILPMLEWIKADNVGPALAGAIVIAGVIILCYAFFATVRDNLLITSAQTILGPGSEANFAKNYNKIDQTLSAVPVISVAWREFKETLIVPVFSDERVLLSPCKNTVRPHEYFNIRSLQLGPDFVRVYPSIFVGVGLSLTFLGLISALDTAVGAINQSGNDSGSMQTAIADLLKISSAKFYASLFALFMSVIMTLSMRAMTWVLIRRIGHLNNLIESSIRFLTTEQLALEGNEIMRGQLSQLNTFNTDLAMKIGQEVQSSLSKTLEPVIMKLDRMGADMTKSNIDMIRSITNEVTDGIKGATAGSMDKVAATLDEISGKLGGLSEALTGALSNFDTDFSQMLEGLKASLQESTTVVADGIGDTMRSMNEDIGKTTAEISQIIAGLTGSIGELSSAGAEICKQGSEELRKQVEEASKAASEQFTKAGEELSDGFRKSTEDLVNGLNRAAISIKEMEGGLSSLPEHLTAVNAELSQSATDIGNAASQFSGASDGLKDLIEPLAEYARSTNDTINTITASLSEASGKVAEASTGIQNSVEQLNGAIASQLARFDNADEQVTDFLTSIQDNTTRVLSEVNAFVTSVDQGFASSLGSLHESITEFEGAVDALREALDQAGKNDSQNSGE
jgi:ABC-type transporter Mla subunit MlaD